ncbi:MAG: hypothetical protein MJE68_08025 [Proteobacteria bacterium]|nr:hypothetical protein [Pseudomonadota bacterium]
MLIRTLFFAFGLGLVCLGVLMLRQAWLECQAECSLVSIAIGGFYAFWFFIVVGGCIMELAAKSHDS